MLRRMPGFSKDTMRTTFCTLVLLFSLTWSLNGHLTTSHKNIEVTSTADNASGQMNYTTDSGTNVVSLSRRAQMQALRSHSDQQGISEADDTSNQGKSGNIHDGEYNLTGMPAQSERQIIQEEVTTPQKELQKPTEGSRRPHAALLQIKNATELNVLMELPNATTADVSPEEKSSRGPMDAQEATQETPSISDFTGLYGDLEGNNNNTNEDFLTMQPTRETTDQPMSMTHAHTSAIITENDFNETVTTKDVKITNRGVVTDKWTSTKGPEFKTSSMIKPTKKLTTPKKTTKKQIYTPSKDKEQANPGPAVAAVIGTTFALMFIAIIVILLKKRKMQRKRLENPEWAGPSPFLDGDVQPNLPNMDEPETINRQGFNQVSITRYLSQRFSKHLTLERNTSEEVLMGDILQGSTFGRKNPDEVQASNGNSTVAQDSTEKKENEINEVQASVDSLDNKTPASGSPQETVMEGNVSNQTDDLTLTPSTGTDTTIKPPTLVSIDLDSLSEEAGPLQTSDGGIVPPAPPLP